jgi:hypothetical protein
MNTDLTVIINSSATLPYHRLVAVETPDGKIPSHFPTTIKSFARLRSSQVICLLRAYHLNVDGKAVERKKQISSPCWCSYTIQEIAGDGKRNVFRSIRNFKC